MSVSIEEAAPACQKMNIAISKETLSEKYNKTLQELVVEYNKKGLPGFRPGKVSKKAVEMKLAKDIREQAIHDSVAEVFSNTAKEKKINVLESAKVDFNYKKKIFTEGVECVISYEVLPSLELLDFSEITIEDSNYNVDSASKTKLLEHFSKTMGSTEDCKDAIIETGNLVSCDMLRTVYPKDGGEAKEEKITDIKLEMGSDKIVPAFNENLISKKLNDEVEFSYEYPSDYEAKEFQGLKADFKVNINKVEKVIPLTDQKELSKKIFPEMSEYNEDEFKKLLDKKLEGVAQQTSYKDIREKLINVLKSSHDFPVPPSLMAVERNSQLKKNPGISVEELEKNLKESLKKEIIIYSYIKELKLEVDESAISEIMPLFAQEHMINESMIQLFMQSPKNPIADMINQYAIEYSLIKALKAKVKLEEIQKQLSEVFKDNYMIG